MQRLLRDPLPHVDSQVRRQARPRSRVSVVVGAPAACCAGVERGRVSRVGGRGAAGVGGGGAYGVGVRRAGACRLKSIAIARICEFSVAYPISGISTTVCDGLKPKGIKYRMSMARQLRYGNCRTARRCVWLGIGVRMGIETVGVGAHAVIMRRDLIGR